MGKVGIVLVNIGSPSGYDTKSVGKYLRLFLMDKKVINIPFILRWILVNLIIVPRRAKYSAGNYKKIWLTKENLSPLIFYSRNFADELQQQLGEPYAVRMAMQYSEPFLPDVLRELIQQNCQEIKVVPMFPQYAGATSGAVAESIQDFKSQNNFSQAPKIKVESCFYPEFSEAQSMVASQSLYGKSYDHYLFSFHGLPESQILADPQCHLDNTCCRSEDACARNCYRAQCFKTAEIIAQKLKIPSEKMSISFQSRLGRAKWLGPYTGDVLNQLPAQGKKNVAVFCPAFVVDCLETLEEIGHTEKEQFLKSGGENLHMVPCPNANPSWVKIFADWINNLSAADKA